MDCYDKAVAYLTQHPEEIYKAWTQPRRHPAGCLFSVVNRRRDYDESRCGCLTQIRQSSDDYEAPTPALTASIRADARLPDHPSDITPANLPVFAAWQRKIDKELNRTPPPEPS